MAAIATQSQGLPHYFESLAINHPFLDGNKRIAFAVTDLFLRMNEKNSYRIHSQPMAIYADMMQMFNTGAINRANAEPWLRTIVVKSEIE